MFRTLSNTEDPLDYSEERPTSRSRSRHPQSRSRSRHPRPRPASRPSKKSQESSSREDLEPIERASTQHEEVEEEGFAENEKVSSGPPPSRPSADLKRTASNTLSRVASRITTHSLADPGPPPDGGLKAWIQVAMGFLVIFTTWGWINSFGAFQTYYTLNLDQSASSISWIGTVQNFLTFFIGALSGRLLDAGYYIPTLIVGVVIQVVGIFMMSLSTQFWQLLLTQGVMTGLGGGIFFTPSLGLVATYFSKKRAIALGVVSTGNAIGGITYPLVVRQLIPQVGFAWTVRVLGFINLTVLALVIAFMRPRLPPRKSGALIDWTAFRELPYVLLCVGMFFQIWSLYFVFYYIGSFAVQSIGLDFSSAATLIIIINGVGVPARVLPGFLVTRIGTLNTCAPLCLCIMIVTWNWLAVNTIPGVYIFTAVYGFSCAAFQSLMPQAVASMTPDMKMVGTRLGMAFTCVSIAALTGSPLGGSIVSRMGNEYWGAQIWAALSTTTCAVMFLLARMSRAEWKVKAWI